MHTLHFARYFAPLADISNQIPPPGAGSPMLLMILAILSFPLFILVLVRRKDAKIVESAQKDGRNIFKITFSPSFLRSQRYSGVGFIEVFNDYITISGRRKWPLKKCNWIFRCRAPTFSFCTLARTIGRTFSIHALFS